MALMHSNVRVTITIAGGTKNQTVTICAVKKNENEVSVFLEEHMVF